jgi:hypothetical protein
MVYTKTLRVQRVYTKTLRVQRVYTKTLRVQRVYTKTLRVQRVFCTRGKGLVLHVCESGSLSAVQTTWVLWLPQTTGGESEINNTEKIQFIWNPFIYENKKYVLGQYRIIFYFSLLHIFKLIFFNNIQLWPYA